MPIGGLDRYAGLQGSGYVELGKNNQIKQVGDTPFFGRVVKWYADGLSKIDTHQQRTNRDVRQNFFMALKETNSDIAQKYSEQLVGTGQQTKPLSARLVRTIMAEVQHARINDGPKTSQSPFEQSIANIVKIGTQAPELRNDIKDHLKIALDSLLKETGSLSEAKRLLAGRLSDEYEKLPLNARAGFVSVMSDPTHMLSEIENQLKKLPQVPLEESLARIVEIGTLFPERQTEIKHHLKAALDVLVQQTGDLSEAKKLLVEKLSGEHDKLLPRDRTTFSSVFASPASMAYKIGAELDRL